MEAQRHASSVALLLLLLSFLDHSFSFSPTYLFSSIPPSSCFPSSITPLPPSRLTGTPDSVYCNRDLNMNAITAIGFDMDYTLAQYKTEFDELAFVGTLDKL